MTSKKIDAKELKHLSPVLQAKENDITKTSKVG